MKFHTNLPPTECLKRLMNPISKSHVGINDTIRRKYGSYFSRTPDKCEQLVGRWDFQVYETSVWYRRIYTDVDADKFEVSVVNWDQRSVPIVNWDKHRNRYSNKNVGNGFQTRYSGTIAENEDGGSTVEFHITRCNSFLPIGCLVIIMLIGLIVMLIIGAIEDPPMPGYYSGIPKMGVMELFFLLCVSLPLYIMEAKSRRLVVGFIKDLLEINDIKKQQVTDRLRKMPKQQ